MKLPLNYEKHDFDCALQKCLNISHIDSDSNENVEEYLNNFLVLNKLNDKIKITDSLSEFTIRFTLEPKEKMDLKQFLEHSRKFQNLFEN